MVAVVLMWHAFMQTSWLMRCALRREFLMMEGVHEVSQAVGADDMEAVVGALMEHFQRMQNELNWQDAHGYSVRHPFTLPEFPEWKRLVK